MSRHSRGSSSDDSLESTGSLIAVAPPATDSSPTPALQATPATVMDSTRSSIGVPSLQSTPPTSLGDLNSEIDASKDEAAPPEAPQSSRRSVRPRTSITTYNDKVMAGTAVHTRTAYLKRDENGNPISRSVSGATLVNPTADEATGDSPLKPKKSTPKLNKVSADVEDERDAAVKAMDKLQRRKSARVQLEDAATNVVGAVSSATTALGKRTRDAIGSTKQSVKACLGESSSSISHIPRMFPNLKAPIIAQESPEPEESEEPEEPEETHRNRFGVKTKKYLDRGLYAGQDRVFDSRLKESSNNKKAAENKALPLPMFAGEALLQTERDFQLPYEILNPLPSVEAPSWKKLSTNRFIGDAASLWKKENAHLDSSYCACKKNGHKECSEHCINRGMQYECNEKNCQVGPECGNRHFAELKWRSQNRNFARRQKDEKGNMKMEGQNLWGEGVETFKTEDRGYGVRAMRSFEPFQIIVEYCGEIITQDECDRRMNEEYKDMTDYYLMIFHDKMIIDATKGSIARFVNHSCMPNCQVEKWTVDGVPRMALFAGERRIVTGEELTYDYNFEAFSENNKQQCLCGAPNCRGVLGPRPAEKRGKARQVVDAMTEVASSAAHALKRKAKQMVQGDNEESSAPKRRKTMPNGSNLLRQANTQKAAVSEDGESRDDRVEKRSASLLTLDSRIKSGQVTKHRSSASAFTVAQLKASAKRSAPKKVYRGSLPLTSREKSLSPAAALRQSTRTSPKTSKLLAMKQGVKKSSSSALGKLNDLKNKTFGSSSTTTNTTIAAASSSTSQTPAPSKAPKPPRASGTYGIWEYVSNPPLTFEETIAAITEGDVEIPKRRSSLGATLKKGTDNTRKSPGGGAARSARKNAAVAKASLKDGDEAVREAMRAVSNGMRA
ncbi:SET domain-containing protein [Tothia fuscella]|uniref:SET domain-containing protein n=1 Tax=Tothia fuscella TaxID=1048955 RepID=A0A9P4NXL7_9PEZI|nr:SET domain-containing protein [Tothia fuscella]